MPSGKSEQGTVQTWPIKYEAYLALEDGAVVQLVRVRIKVQQHTQHIPRRCSGSTHVLGGNSSRCPLARKQLEVNTAKHCIMGTHWPQQQLRCTQSQTSLVVCQRAASRVYTELHMLLTSVGNTDANGVI